MPSGSVGAVGRGIQAVWPLCRSVMRGQGQVTQGFSVQVGIPLQDPAEAGEARAGSGDTRADRLVSRGARWLCDPSVAGRGALPDYCWWLPSRVSQSWGEG